jgi:hypothetical protein
LNSQETYHFDQLKRAVFEVFSKSHSTPQSFERFGKDDIVAFQEDLFRKVNTQVSEKWFYTYFKNAPTKLPRIDMLNLLSQYVGYQNWNEFKINSQQHNSKKRHMIWLVPLLLLVILGFVLFPQNNQYHFCFVDADKGEVISNPVTIEILSKNQSPIHRKIDANGCLNYASADDQIIFVVKSNYYKTDTIIRSKSHQQGEIYLQLDDYALMLDYYSKGKVSDFKDRKQQLENLIDDQAVIYQLYSNKNDVEIYSKKEFINLLIIPTNSLKNIQYLNKEFEGDKIVKLKFMVK